MPTVRPDGRLHGAQPTFAGTGAMQSPRRPVAAPNHTVRNDARARGARQAWTRLRVQRNASPHPVSAAAPRQPPPTRRLFRPAT